MIIKVFYLISSILFIFSLVSCLWIYLPILGQSPEELNLKLPEPVMKNQPQNNEKQNNENKIDISCEIDADCEIKDVGNNCGYYPVCVNKNFTPHPPELNSVICGFPSINNCQCFKEKCQGFFK